MSSISLSGKATLLPSGTSSGGGLLSEENGRAANKAKGLRRVCRAAGDGAVIVVEQQRDEASSIRLVNIFDRIIVNSGGGTMKH